MALDVREVKWEGCSTSDWAVLTGWDALCQRAQLRTQAMDSQSRFGLYLLFEEFELALANLQDLLSTIVTSQEDGSIDQDPDRSGLQLPPRLANALDFHSPTFKLKPRAQVEPSGRDLEWLWPGENFTGSYDPVKTPTWPEPLEALPTDIWDGVKVPESPNENDSSQGPPSGSLFDSGDEAEPDLTPLDPVSSCPCPQCGRIFKIAGNLTQHRKRCRGRPQCSLCHRVFHFSAWRYLARHEARCHGQAQPFLTSEIPTSGVLPPDPDASLEDRCEQLIQTIPSDAISEANLKLSQCLICGHRQKRRVALRRHVQKCLSGLQCRFCSQSFQLHADPVRAWTDHEALCENPGRRDMFESGLSVGALKPGDPQSQSEPKVNRSYQCEVCETIFHSQASGQKHARLCGLKKELHPFFHGDHYQCACTYKGLRLGSFKRHVDHCTILPFCQKCERRFQPDTPLEDIQVHGLSCPGRLPPDTTEPIETGEKASLGPIPAQFKLSIVDSRPKIRGSSPAASESDGELPQTRNYEGSSSGNDESSGKSQCNTCQSVVSNLKLHRKSCESSQVCQFCKKAMVRSAASFQAHQDKCERVQVNKGLVPHFQMLHNEFLCTFPDCSNNQNTFSTYYQLQMHFSREHVTQEDLPHQCDICQRRFISRKIMMRHRYQHKERHNCPECGKGFFEKMRMIKHRLVHTDTKPYSCPKEACEYRTKLKSSVDRHLRTVHKETVGRDYFCETCGTAFLSRAALDVHRERVHLNPKPPKIHYCDKCSFSTKRASFFKQHVEYRCQFDGTNKCICETCGKALKTKESLRDHVTMIHLKQFTPGQIRKRDKARKRYEATKLAGEPRDLNPLLPNTMSISA